MEVSKVNNMHQLATSDVRLALIFTVTYMVYEIPTYILEV
jgi:hypothetical protein